MAKYFSVIKAGGEKVYNLGNTVHHTDVSSTEDDNGSITLQNLEIEGVYSSQVINAKDKYDYRYLFNATNNSHQITIESAVYHYSIAITGTTKK